MSESAIMARVLMVDDEPDVLLVLKSLFEIEGITAVTINDGNEAVEMIKSQEKFDLMISDIRMEPIDGIALLELARETRSTMPVIMVTAYHTPEAARNAIQKGAFDYIRKPFDPEELIQSAKKAIESAQ